MRKLLILVVLAAMVLGVALSMLLFEYVFEGEIDNTFIIWNFSIAIVIGIIVLTIMWLMSKKKEKKGERKIVYYQTEEKDKYRTEYY